MGPKQAVESFSGGRTFKSSDDDGIAAIRKKVMFDLHAVADKMKDQILKEGLEEGEVFVSPSLPPLRPLSPARITASSTPWSLDFGRVNGLRLRVVLLVGRLFILDGSASGGGE
ncbi:uncharacterized protein Fot_13253 [Forsythia ovata]|uniref:Uncharacterized protein n=1 Tax=Forsythia ovata TaxID=205694 RepID=A0ABD1W2X8_9LAMI